MADADRTGVRGSRLVGYFGNDAGAGFSGIGLLAAAGSAIGAVIGGVIRNDMLPTSAKITIDYGSLKGAGANNVIEGGVESIGGSIGSITGGTTGRLIGGMVGLDSIVGAIGESIGSSLGQYTGLLIGTAIHKLMSKAPEATVKVIEVEFLRLFDNKGVLYICGTAGGIALGASVVGGVIWAMAGGQVVLQVGIAALVGVNTVFSGAIFGAMAGAMVGRFTSVGMATGARVGAVFGAVNAGVLLVAMAKSIGKMLENDRTSSRAAIAIRGATNVITGATAIGALVGGITGILLPTRVLATSGIGAGLGALVGMTYFFFEAPRVTEVAGTAGNELFVLGCIEISFFASVGAIIGAQVTRIGESKGAKIGIVIGCFALGVIAKMKVNNILAFKADADTNDRVHANTKVKVAVAFAAIGTLGGLVLGRFLYSY